MNKHRRKDLSLSEMVKKALNTNVKTKVNGREERLSYQEIIIKQIIKKCAEGDLKAINLLLENLPPQMFAKRVVIHLCDGELDF